MLNKEVYVASSGSLTQRGLQHVSVFLTGSDGLDIRGVHQPPEVVAVVAPVQSQTQTDSGQAHHSGDAHGSGISWVVGLQFHSHLEVI